MCLCAEDYYMHENKDTFLKLQPILPQLLQVCWSMQSTIYIGLQISVYIHCQHLVPLKEAVWCIKRSGK